MTDLIDSEKLKQIVEAALMAADEPLTVDRLTRLFAHGELDSEEGRAQIRDTLTALEAEAEGRGYELKRVASGYRYQVRQELADWVSRLWEEKPPRYSRALLETLALIAYRQPVTRGDIEEVRGVSVSQNIMRTLQERGWIRVVGQREVPGKPSLYGTTREFLDYFNLKSLDQLPPLADIKSLIEPLVVDDSEASDKEPRAGGPLDHEASPQEPLDAESPDAETPDTESSDHAWSEETAEVTEPPETPDHGHDRHDDEDVGPAAGERESQSGEAEEQAHQPEPPSAEVVRLPTPPRR